MRETESKLGIGSACKRCLVSANVNPDCIKPHGHKFIITYCFPKAIGEGEIWMRSLQDRGESHE